MDILKVGWNNFLQRPLLDRIFYVPFWDCPYLCDFCCVASLPGKPKEDLTKGESTLFSLLAILYKNLGEPIQVHVYGGEPLLRPDYIWDLARRLKETKMMKRFYLYSTLRPRGLEKIVEALGEKNLRVIVNPTTINSSVKSQMNQFPKIIETYKNPVFFPTGRAKIGEKAYRRTIWERILPFGMPGKACFANVSGPLVNGEHGTVHLCCLPQSPVVGETVEPADLIWKRYREKLKEYWKEVEQNAKEKGYSFACSVCESKSQWDTRVRPDTSHLKNSEVF